MAEQPKQKHVLPEIPPFLHATDKRTTILRAAMFQFLQKGFSATTMDAITLEAGVSKATVYAHFSSKEALFEMLMREGSAAVFSEFPLLEHHGGDPEEELHNFLVGVLEHILIRGGCSWDRLIIAEAVRHPHLSKLFRQCTLDRLTDSLEQYLQRLMAEQQALVGNSRMLAESLLALTVIGALHHVLLNGPPNEVDGKRLRFEIRLFLRGIGISGSFP